MLEGMAAGLDSLQRAGDGRPGYPYGCYGMHKHGVHVLFKAAGCGKGGARKDVHFAYGTLAWSSPCVLVNVSWLWAATQCDVLWDGHRS